VTRTPDLIDALVECGTPVRRLRPPLLRAAAWLTFAGAVVGLLTTIHGVRPDLAECLREPVFVASIVAALVTGILATVSSFMLSLPDRSRLWILLPAPALAVWISSLGYGCLTDWVSIRPDGLHIGQAVRCFATLLLTSVPLSLAMLVMLRYAALLRVDAVAMMGGLAVAAISSSTLGLTHQLDATLMILLWNFGTAAIIVGLSGQFGHTAFSWIASRLPTIPNDVLAR
jgi:hypothetical protein